MLYEPLNQNSGFFFRKGTLLEQGETPYQTYEVWDTPQLGKLFRLDGYFMTSERDEFFYHENMIHPALISHPNPRSILIIGGGDGGSADEVFKHPSIERIVLVELDPAVVDLSRRFFESVHHGSLDDPRLEILIKDPDLRARIADVVWLVGQRGKVLCVAAEAYLESTQRLLNPEDWVASVERLKRAVDLSRRMGKKGPLFTRVMSFIESTIGRNRGILSFFVLKLIKIMIEHECGNPELLAEVAGEIAAQAEEHQKFRMASNYWELQSRCYFVAGKETESRSAIKKQAEVVVRDALEGSPFSHMRASIFLGNAIELYRRIGGEQERVKELHKEMLKQEQQMLEGEMESFEFKLPEEIEHRFNELNRTRIEEILSSPDIDKAFKVLFKSGSIVTYDQISEEVKEGWKTFSISALVKGFFVTDGGKKIADSKSQYADDFKEREEALEQQIIQKAQQYHQFCAVYQIEPIRQTMAETFPPDTIDWDSYVRGSVFVPHGREKLFSEALKAGYSGDYIVSTHILATQWEHTLRYILQGLGALTSKLDDDLNQDELSLSTLLSFESIEQFFQGKDIPLNLRVSLGEKLGANLRNKVAHGLMSDHDFYQPAPIYLWWITLFLICSGAREQRDI